MQRAVGYPARMRERTNAGLSAPWRGVKVAAAATAVVLLRNTLSRCPCYVSPLPYHSQWDVVDPTAVDSAANGCSRRHDSAPGIKGNKDKRTERWSAGNAGLWGRGSDSGILFKGEIAFIDGEQRN